MMPARRLSAKSSVTVASGPIMRSTDECEISRSCHSATFSIAGIGVGAHHAGQAGDVFRQHRIALVRHRRRALLALREELLCFQHFGALQMADFRWPAARPTRRRRRALRNTSHGGRAGSPASRSAPASGPSPWRHRLRRADRSARSVPTAPEMAQVAISLRAATRRSLARSNSA